MSDSSPGNSSQLVALVSDWANPILVKETRQSLKSRQFVVTFMLLLFVSWLISLVGVLTAGRAIETGSPGQTFFTFYYGVLAIAIFVIVPFATYRSLLNERDQFTFEILSITSLSPRQIVWGKLQSALLQILIYYSAIAPFIAFASLLQGFNLPQASFLLIASFLVSLEYCMFSLMLSTLVKQKAAQGMVSALLLFALLFIIMSFVGSSISMLVASVEFSDPRFWKFIGLCLVVGVSYFVLFQQIAVAQLTFESDDHSSAIRATCAAMFWMLWAGLIGYMMYERRPLPEGMLIAAVVISSLHWAAVGLFSVTELDVLSHRVKRGLPRSVLLRAVRLPFLPGGARGLLYVSAHLVALWGVAWAGAIVSSSLGAPPFAHRAIEDDLNALLTYRLHEMSPLLRVSLGCSLYLLFYMGVGALLNRWFVRFLPEARPAHARVTLFLVVTAGIILPFLLRTIGLVHWGGFSLLDVTNPFSTLYFLMTSAADPDMTAALSWIALGAVCAIGANVPTIMRESAAVLRPEPRIATPLAPAAAPESSQPPAATEK